MEGRLKRLYEFTFPSLLSQISVTKFPSRERSSSSSSALRIVHFLPLSPSEKFFIYLWFFHLRYFPFSSLVFFFSNAPAPNRESEGKLILTTLHFFMFYLPAGLKIRIYLSWTLEEIRTIFRVAGENMLCTPTSHIQHTSMNFHCRRRISRTGISQSTTLAARTHSSNTIILEFFP